MFKVLSHELCSYWLDVAIQSLTCIIFVSKVSYFDVNFDQALCRLHMKHGSGE